MTWGINEAVAAVSAALALASLVLNWLIVRRQTALQFESLKAQMDSEVLAWVHEAIDLVSLAMALARGGGVYRADELQRLAFETNHRLSSVADRGRLFFPNESPDEHGQDKEAAFQGYRQPILDAVIFASTQLEKLEFAGGGPDEDVHSFLVKCRRLLVSEAQNAIDPRRRGQMLRRLATGRMDDKRSAFAIAAELGEALEARFPGTLVQRRDAAWIDARERLARRK